MFVTLEGLDFSGKSTLVRSLKHRFADSTPPVRFTREPGGTPVAERIRDILLNPEMEMDAWTEAYLYAAARADHVRRAILPMLNNRGESVVCERFVDSSIAYQGYGRGLGAEAVRRLNAWAIGNLLPDRTFYLRLGAEERRRRAHALGTAPDRLEAVGVEFMQRVEEGFEEIARREPERVVVLDAERSPDQLVEAVVGEIHTLL